MILWVIVQYLISSISMMKQIQVQPTGWTRRTAVLSERQPIIIVVLVIVPTNRIILALYPRNQEPAEMILTIIPTIITIIIAIAIARAVAVVVNPTIIGSTRRIGIEIEQETTIQTEFELLFINNQ